MVAMINTVTMVTVWSCLGTHLTTFDTVDQSRLRVPLEASRADDSLWRQGDGSDGFGSMREHLFAGTTFHHPTTFWVFQILTSP